MPLIILSRLVRTCGVHLGHPGVSGGLGGLDQGEGAAAVFTQFGEELRSGEEDRAGQAGVGVRAAFLHRQSAVAVRQRLGGHPVAGLGPLRLGQRPVGVDVDPLALDVDLGGLFPAPAHGLVGDPGVVRGHLGRLVVEQDADDLLRDVAVDQPAGEGVPPLVRCQVHGFAVLVADVAERQPAVQHAAVAVVAQRPLPAGVAGELREQVRVLLGPPGGDPLLLGSDLGLEVGVDRDGGLAAHLVVEVAQVGGALPVVEQAVEGQRAGVGGAQAAADQDQGDQPALGVGQRSRLAGASTWAMTCSARRR